ncbi:MAG: hypothetical protein PHE89_01445 [Alphaproteobacteria bacterium]|nr:hypothetical protein [Alphaproteobacteria bacterium]
MNVTYKYSFPAVLGTTFFVPLSSVNATTPSCNDMGYTMATTDCNNSEEIVKCPFDLSKVYCVKKVIPKTCADYGYITTQPTGKYCTSVSIDGLDCYVNDCKTDYCERYSGHYAAVPSGQTCTQQTVNGLNCYYNCVTVTQTCESAGYLTEEPSGKSCPSVSLDDGTICYDSNNCTNSSSGSGGTTPMTEAQCLSKYSQYVWNRCDSHCISGATEVYDSNIPTECRFPSLLSCDCLGSWL